MDASLKGWGAHLKHQTASGLWNQLESRHHINILELKAVFLALKSVENQLLNQNMLISTDITLQWLPVGTSREALTLRKCVP